MISKLSLRILCFLILFGSLVVESKSQSFDSLKVKYIRSYYDSNYVEVVETMQKMKVQYDEKLNYRDYILLARSCAMLGRNSESIKAINHAIDNGFTDEDKLLKDDIFKALSGQAGWQDVIKRVKEKKVEMESNIKFQSIAKELQEMHMRDQEIRQLMAENFKNGIAEIPDSLVRKASKNDSLNLARLKEIIKQIGWPGISLVGEDGNVSAFLIAQHADSDRPAQKKFLELLEESVKKGDSNPTHLAYLADRVLRSMNEPQLYGTQAWINPETQSFEIAPIKDRKNVDVRRMLLWLSPLKVYEKQMGITQSEDNQKN